jgi:hypothetical protein
LRGESEGESGGSDGVGKVEEEKTKKNTKRLLFRSLEDLGRREREAYKI